MSIRTNKRGDGAERYALNAKTISAVAAFNCLYFTILFSLMPGLNFTTFAAGIDIVSPV